ncbi:hypothetical protein DEO72_LG5g1626 [Vigna unguiculata]|uniref:Uncharacterized protein n=1 Tax=Vigna unguiculata TaxID=3917 RepID=A0A4D6LYW8_VIGUN|nr:hypothetical protein DEO72_LG5g1626 [Vigna unguiculata]
MIIAEGEEPHTRQQTSKRWIFSAHPRAAYPRAKCYNVSIPHTQDGAPPRTPTSMGHGIMSRPLKHLHEKSLAQARAFSRSSEFPSPRRELEEGTVVLSHSLAWARPPRLSEMSPRSRLDLVA